VVRIWHGLLMENLAQAIAYDLLQGALRRLDVGDEAVRLHIHDEAVVETDIAKADQLLPEFLDIMAEGEDWSDGLPIKAEGKISPVYVK
jgi:hypothetical protein